MYIDDFLNSKKTNALIKFDKIFEQGYYYGRYKSASRIQKNT